jgi:hypothetical protein
MSTNAIQRFMDDQHAVEGLTKAMAVELAPKVRVVRSRRPSSPRR